MLKNTNEQNNIVYKFGGSSVGSTENIDGVANIISSCDSKVVVVVSAMGGTTDKLLLAAREAVTGNLQPAHVASSEFSNRHLMAIKSLISDPVRAKILNRKVQESVEEFMSICHSLKILKEHTPRILDVTVARGERVMARLLTAALEEKQQNAIFLDATRIIEVENKSGIIIPAMSACISNAQRILLPLLEKYQYIIIPGYIAKGENNEIITLGRGGSDYSATILASCIGARNVTLFKEVDGLLTTDPKLVPNARVIPRLRYREAAELAYCGAKILHPRTIIPLLDKKIPLIIKNSFRPSFPGSIISDESPGEDYPVKALTAMTGQTLISVEGNAMMGVPGIAGKAFGALAQGNISVSVISQASSEASICFVVLEEDAKASTKILTDLFELEIKNRHINTIKSKPNLAVIAVVGVGMKGTPGIAARIFSALAEQKVNICTIAQGSSELNISFAIEEKDLEKSLIALHKEYQLDKLRPLPNRVEKRVEVNIYGFGQIGTTLAEQILQQEDYFKNTLQISCLCTSLIDRSSIEVSENGFTSKDLKNIIMSKRSGRKLSRISPGNFSDNPNRHSFERHFTTVNNPDTIDTGYGNQTGNRHFSHIQQLSAKLFHLPQQRGIFVDLTADETAPVILKAINNGFHIVLANKKPLAVKQTLFDEMFEAAKTMGVQIRYEATVGAGLPILDTLTKLESTGDQVVSVFGCLSGTLGYLMTKIEEGRKFSESVSDAYKAGFTEPDPREDLSGLDVARKALILSRALGRQIEMSDIHLEPLFDQTMSNDDPKVFISNLKSMDDEFTDRIARASRENCVLRYIARISDERVSVGIEAVPSSSPLGRLSGTNNQLTIKTKRYDANPLIVTGPGAGAEVTAAGALNDIIAIAIAEKAVPR